MSPVSSIRSSFVRSGPLGLLGAVALFGPPGALGQEPGQMSDREAQRLRAPEQVTKNLPGQVSRRSSNRIPTLMIELEAGPVWQSYNDVEIPNDGTATRFSLYDLAGAGPWLGARLYVTWNLNERHSLRALAAPVSLTETGVPAEEVRFAGSTLQPGVPTEATYTFNSYRVGYRYAAHRGERTTGRIGFTAKLRDATIALSQNGTSSRKDDLGFVPLLHLSGDWRLSSRWRLSADVEGLAGGPGRAIDAAVEVGWDREQWSLEAGYRTVEGGADVPDVYTFAWLHSAVLSLVWRW